MRKFLISAALAATALTAAAPAAAQWYPPQPQGNAYGYYGNYGQARRLDARIDTLQRQINHLDRRNILSEREAARLRFQARELERQLRFAARNGLHPQEAYAIDRRIQRLEYRLHRDARDGNRFGYNDHRGWNDRDRDGRDDRWEGRHEQWHDRNDDDHDDDD